MSITLLLVLVVIFSFAIGHFVTRYASRYVVLSGAEYILVGVLIGSQVGLGLVGQSALDRLQPLFALLLGLVGFLVGLRGRQAVQRFETSVIGFVSAIGVVAVSAALFLPGLVAFVPIGDTEADFVVHRVLYATGHWVFEVHFTSGHLWLALSLGAAACVASPILVEGIKRVNDARGPVTDLLESSARVSQIVAVVVLGMVLATARATDAANRFSLTITEWELAATAGGVVCGLLFSLFIGRETDRSRIFLASIGLVTFASGLATGLGISSLFVNLVTGLTVGVTSPHAERLRRELDRLQHALFVLLMIFAGTLWRPIEGWLWAFPVYYTIMRFLARRAVTATTVRLLSEQPPSVRRLGNGLLGQGTLAVAVAVDYSLRIPRFASLVLTTILLGTLLSDLWSMRALRTLLADAGELGTGDGSADSKHSPDSAVHGMS